MKERCRDGCRTSLLIAGVFLVPAIFHTSLPPCHPYITIHFMEMIFSTCIYKISMKTGDLPRVFCGIGMSVLFGPYKRHCVSSRALLMSLFSLVVGFWILVQTLPTKSSDTGCG